MEVIRRNNDKKKKPKSEGRFTPPRQHNETGRSQVDSSNKLLERPKLLVPAIENSPLNSCTNNVNDYLIPLPGPPVGLSNLTNDKKEESRSFLYKLEVDAITSSGSQSVVCRPETYSKENVYEDIKIPM